MSRQEALQPFVQVSARVNARIEVWLIKPSVDGATAIRSSSILCQMQALEVRNFPRDIGSEKNLPLAADGEDVLAPDAKKALR